MINFDFSKDGFKAECSDNDTAEIIIATAVGVSLVTLASAGAYFIVNKVSEAVAQALEE